MFTPSRNCAVATPAAQTVFDGGPQTVGPEQVLSGEPSGSIGKPPTSGLVALTNASYEMNVPRSPAPVVIDTAVAAPRPIAWERASRTSVAMAMASPKAWESTRA